MSLREAQHHLAKLVGVVEKGEEVVLTRRGKPIVRIVPLDPVMKSWDRVIDSKSGLEAIDQKVGDRAVYEKNIVLEMREDERF